MEGPHVTRQRCVNLLICVGWIFLWLRVGAIQCLDHEIFLTKSIRQRVRPVKLTAKRGTILDRNGVVLAVDLERSNVEGLDNRPRFRRYYPLGATAAQVIGYTDVDGNGIQGLEIYSERQLAGLDGRGKAYYDAMGLAKLSLEAPEIEPRNGSDVVLTIDSRIQEIADQELEKGVRRVNARWGGVIVLNPSTGEILAMSNAPRLDLNDPESFRTSTDPALRRNKLVTDMYEPGSTFKIVTFAEALESGVINEDDIIDCEEGNFVIMRHRINDTHKMGKVSAREVLVQSSNIGCAKIALALGRRNLYERASLLGYGTVTGIDFPNESRGMLASPARWSDLNVATISFGHGIAASPLQVAMSFAAIANDGVLVRARLIKDNGDIENNEVLQPETIRRAMSKETASRLTDILKEAVERGTGRTVALPNVQVAGKTGTAQRVREDGRGYEEGKYVSSFVGFTIDTNPRLVCLVVIDSPEGEYYGSLVAGPVFRNIMNRVLNMSHIQHASATMEPVPPVISQQSRDIRGKIIHAATGRILDLGASGIRDSEASQFESSITSTQDGIQKRVPNKFSQSEDNVIVPDVTGLTLREAVRNLVNANLEVNIVGSGKVAVQHPKPGTVVEYGTICTIECRN